MRLPDSFSEATNEAIQQVLPTGQWVLIVTTDSSDQSNHLIHLLNKEMVVPCLENFRCFQVPFGSDLCSRYSLETPATLYVLVGSAVPYREYLCDDIRCIDDADIVQFLDDTAAFIELEDEAN